MIKRLEEKAKNIGIKKIMKKNQVVILALALMLMTAGYLNYTNNHENENLLLAGLGDAQLVSTNAVDASFNTVDVNNENQKTEEVDSNEQTQNENTDMQTQETNGQTQNENTNMQTQEANVNGQTQNENTDMQTQETNENGQTQNENTNMQTQEVNTNVQEESTNANTQEVSTNLSKDDYFTRSKLERETMYSQMLETYTGILENEKISSEQKDIAENEIKNINDTKNAIMIVENLFKTKGFENAIVFVNNPSVNVVIKAKELGTEQVAQVQNIVQRELKVEIENIHITTN